MNEQATNTTPQISEEITLIRQTELREYSKLCAKIDADTKKKEEMETSIKNLIIAGVKVEDGKLTAELKYTERRTPKWKELAIGLAEKVFGLGQGTKWADDTIKATEPSTSIKLVVE